MDAGANYPAAAGPAVSSKGLSELPAVASPRTRLVLRRVRFGTRTLLLATTLLCVSLGYWVTWPSRVANEFCHSLRHPTRGTILDVKLIPQERGWIDLVFGHQQFMAHIDLTLNTQTNPRYQFGVTRGKIDIMLPGVSGLFTTLIKSGGDTRNIYQRMAEEQHDTQLIYDVINKALRAGGNDYYIYHPGGVTIAASSKAVP